MAAHLEDRHQRQRLKESVSQLQLSHRPPVMPRPKLCRGAGSGCYWPFYLMMRSSTIWYDTSGSECITVKLQPPLLAVPFKTYTARTSKAPFLLEPAVTGYTQSEGSCSAE
jgi:hypothetical protein